MTLKSLKVLLIVFLVLSGCIETPETNKKETLVFLHQDAQQTASPENRILRGNEEFRQSKFQKHFWPRERMSYQEKHAQMMLWEANKKCDEAIVQEYGSMARYQDHLLDYQKRRDNDDRFFRVLGKNHCPKCRKWVNGEGRIETR